METIRYVEHDPREANVAGAIAKEYGEALVPVSGEYKNVAFVTRFFGEVHNRATNSRRECVITSAGCFVIDRLDSESRSGVRMENIDIDNIFRTMAGKGFRSTETTLDFNSGEKTKSIRLLCQRVDWGQKYMVDEVKGILEEICDQAAKQQRIEAANNWSADDVIKNLKR